MAIILILSTTTCHPYADKYQRFDDAITSTFGVK